MESPRRGVAAADPAGRAAPIHRQRTSFFFQAILPGLDLLLPRTDEKLDALPSAYFRWEWEGPGTKGLNFANFRARKRNRRLYSRRALLFPTTADSYKLACSQPWSGTFTMGYLKYYYIS